MVQFEKHSDEALRARGRDGGPAAHRALLRLRELLGLEAEER